MTNKWYLLLKFIVSIIVPYLTIFIEPKATWSTKILLGISVFLGWSSVDLLHIVNKLEADCSRSAELWVLEHEFDKTLVNIRTHYREILKDFYDESDLFREYFHDKFAELENVLQTAAKRKQLSVRDFHFQRTELLLSSFRGDESGILRYVWILHKDEPLFDEKWQHYCDQILKGTTDGAIKGVRALLVLGEGVSEQDLVVRTLAGF